MLKRIFAVAIVAAFVAWVGPVSAEDLKAGTHEGKVVKVEAGKLTMTDKDGKNEHTHAIPADAKITLDGKASKLEDLKAGQSVKVTVEKKDEKLSIVSIDAKSP
jgi:hypothetical protein